jgi:hypothetical protein
MPDTDPRRLEIVTRGRQQGRTWDQLAEEVGNITAKGLSAWWAGRTRTAQEMAKFRARLKRPVEPKPNTTPRKCLRCQKTFDSEGPHNRMCGSCRNVNI